MLRLRAAWRARSPDLAADMQGTEPDMHRTKPNRCQKAKDHYFGKASGGGSGCCVRPVQQNHAPQSLPGAQCTE